MGLPKSSFSFSKRYYGYLHIDVQTFWPTQYYTGLPSGSLVKSLPDNAQSTGSIPWSGRCPGEGNGNPFQFTCLENSMNRGAWWAIVHGVTKSKTRLKQLSIAHTFMPIMSDEI